MDPARSCANNSLHRKHFDFGAHEAAERILRRADNRLAAHIETGVHHYGTASQVLEFRDERMVTGIGVGVHGLDAGRIIHVRHGRDLGARHMELSMPNKARSSPSWRGAGLASRPPPAAYTDCRLQVRTNRSRLRAAPKERRGEGFPVFHFQVEYRLHGGRSGPSPRSSAHPALSDRIPLRP